MAHFAHTRRGRGEETWELLEDHLHRVANTAANFALSYGREEAYAAGLLHDIGKYRKVFQDYIRTSSDEGFSEDGPAKKVKHSIVGAWWAFEKARFSEALAIAGHHGRLPAHKDFVRNETDGKKFLAEAFANGLPVSLLDPLKTDQISNSPTDNLERAMFTRFVFSALVDADSLETEKWDCGHDRWRCESKLGELLEKLEARLNELSQLQPSKMNLLRVDVQDDCRLAADSDPGAFRLTVPTGGGKTLASLLFGLKHAIRNGQQRIIVVIPYTSIIDQTVKQYRKILGDEAVLEHHSNIDPEADNKINHRCVENWDSPVVVTTNVQFFETLYSARKSALRKLHNIANSVVILDEVQTFPFKWLQPICKALDHLVKLFRVSTVHCSATQPLLAQAGAREIIPNVPRIFAATRGRVTIQMPVDLKTPVAWPQLAKEVRNEPAGRVLVIVHQRKDALQLAQELGDGCIHLSAYMCSLHRLKVIERIKAQVKIGPCIVVSTQLVEAGVDIDFPVVYRALGGLDSLAQSAGRCNREGAPEPGQFKVFVAPSDPPSGTPRKGLQEMRILAKNNRFDILDPTAAQKFFKALESLSQDDPENILGKERVYDFPLVEEKFQYIEDDGKTHSIVAPYGEDWLQRVSAVESNPNIMAFRRLQPLMVSLYEGDFKKLQATGCIKPLGAKEKLWSVLPSRVEDVYSTKFGFFPQTDGLLLVDGTG